MLSSSPNSTDSNGTVPIAVAVPMSADREVIVDLDWNDGLTDGLHRPPGTACH